jgi:hypothetical protein
MLNLVFGLADEATAVRVCLLAGDEETVGRVELQLLAGAELATGCEVIFLQQVALFLYYPSLAPCLSLQAALIAGIDHHIYIECDIPARRPARK